MINARQAEMEGILEENEDAEVFLEEVLYAPFGPYWPCFCAITWQHAFVVIGGNLEHICLYLFPDFFVLYACASPWF